jgi:transcriptional regulator with XRE-family HTH domain
MTNTSERLVERLKETGMQQSDLVRAAKVSRAAVSGWISGETKEIKPRHLFHVARALGVDPEWLSTGNGEKFQSITNSEKINKSYVAREKAGNYLINEEKRELIAMIESMPESKIRALLEIFK